MNCGKSKLSAPVLLNICNGSTVADISGGFWARRNGMEALGSVDDLLDFSSDIGEDDDDNTKKSFPSLKPKCGDPLSLDPLGLDDPNSFSECAEEELEWLSNKDAFPAVETFVDLACIQPDIMKYQRTAPMLENSTSSSNSNNSSNSITLLSGYNHIKFPVRARSKSRSKPRLGLADTSNQHFSWRLPSNKVSKERAVQTLTIGRKCNHCGAESTPQWRAGPNGPKTLCNACGVRFKSGRLVPEYRPANSPTFRSDVHSNSHRKVLEMRKHKGMG
ncbi:GATA transcription factor 1 isoform X1 [Lathyrus oleraceus]|nr:GATA transcription factor 1 isoform X1 [Pisum sativum]